MSQYIHPTPEAGKQFFMDYNSKGKVVMLNLLRFRKTADYSNLASIRPADSITGEEAYQLYIDHTLSILEKMGSKVLYYDQANQFLIGPESESWDVLLLVEHQSAEKFISFAQNEEYLKGAGHRTAALADSRLLPASAL